MTEENALEAWGWPRQVNKTTTVGGVREQWVYEFGRRHDYIYLENGVVTSIQEQAAIVLNLF